MPLVKSASKEAFKAQRGEGTVRGQAAAASAGDRVFGAAKGQEGRAPSVEAKVALLKRQRGELLTNREAKLVRDYEKSAPAIETPVVQTTPKYRGRQFGSAERRENFVNAYSSAVDTALADLTAQGVTATPNKLQRAATLLKRSAEDAVMAKDDAAGAMSSMRRWVKHCGGSSRKPRSRRSGRSSPMLPRRRCLRH